MNSTIGKVGYGHQVISSLPAEEHLWKLLKNTSKNSSFVLVSPPTSEGVLRTTWMKAIVWTKYGPPDVLQFNEVERPVPKDNEVLIKVHAATVTAGDCELRRFDIPIYLWLPVRIYMGILKPGINVLGQELAGEVITAGKKVTQFKPGDQVFAAAEMSLGAYAEYACLKSKATMVIKPANMNYEEAATIPTGGIKC